MTPLSRTERAALCDTALKVGPSVPTLCGDWSVADLVTHLLVRERSLGALGIVVSPLSGLTDRAMARIGGEDFTVLVERVRQGPPRWTPFALPPLDALANSFEFLVHHEDIRRAQPDWEPRAFSGEQEAAVWSMLTRAGRLLASGSTVGIEVANLTTGSTRVIRAGARSVTVRGLPTEIALVLFGRVDQARVELEGDPEDVAALKASPLGP